MKHHYNTTNLSGERLKAADQKAASQEQEILSIFKEYPYIKFRAFDIEQLLIGRLSSINHDSCKRAITNLTKRGLLIRSDRAECPGPYGMAVNVWQYNPQAKEVAA